MARQLIDNPILYYKYNNEFITSLVDVDADAPSLEYRSAPAWQHMSQSFCAQRQSSTVFFIII